MMQREITAAIYLRLSRDDGGDAESNSIGNQREQLRRYAQDNSFLVYQEYVDDGWSGTSFERPAFKRMVEDIEAGFIGAVLIKDLSRLGRNNAMVAFYTEMFFPDNDVRLVAINDCIDTGKGENEIMAFKSVINEYYARDISRKIRSARRTLAQKGYFCGALAPYGYKKDPQDKHKLLVDEEAASVVRQIFQMAGEGLGVYQIARRLFDAKIPVPNAYKAMRGEKVSRYNAEFPHDWMNTTVRSILTNRVYVGDMVSHKQSNKSFKNHTLVRYPESEWITVEGTHEGIIDADVFERVQRLVKVKKRENALKQPNIFAGLLKCFDCGSALNFHSATQSKNKEGRFLCNKYRHTNVAAAYSKCTIHSVAYRTLYDLTLERLNGVISANLTEDELVRRISKNRASDNASQKNLEKLKRRDSELRQIVRKIVEQNALGQITPATFADLYDGYKSEQESTMAKIQDLEIKLSQGCRDRENARHFIEAVRKYTATTELTREMLLDLIDRIVVHEATGDYRRRTREQTIDFHYRFIGKLN